MTSKHWRESMSPHSTNPPVFEVRVKKLKEILILSGGIARMILW